MVHPNNHVNLSQSTNDAYPTALKVAAIWSLRDLEQAVGGLRDAFLQKGDEFSDVVKMGRTQLQDAVPMKKEWLSRAELDRILSPDTMTRPRVMPGR